MPKEITRILTIAPTPFFADRGCHIHIAEQIWALKRQDKDVLLVTYGIGRDVPKIKTRRTPKIPFYKKESIGPSWHKFYVDILLLFTSLKAAWQYKPQVIHAHLHEGCLVGWIISRIYNIPLVFDCQGSLTGELIAHNFILTKTKILRNIWYRLEKIIDHLPDMILAQSTEMHRELTKDFKVNPSKITMAFDGVNTKTFQPRKKDSQLLEKLQLPQDKPIVAYLGGLTTHKGVDTLLKAFAIVKEKHPDAFFLLMGYPNEVKYFKQAQKHGISDHVRITGRIKYEDAPKYLALGDIAVAPKRTQTEANGKIYNYMAAGLPTIAFDTVVNRNILGDLGVYTNPEKDYQGLATAISNLLANTSKRELLAKDVRRLAVKKYSWDNVAKRIILSYKQVRTPWQMKVFKITIRKKAKWRWLKPRLEENIKSDHQCLDVGSGTGMLSYQQEKIGGRWNFIETDSQAAAQTREIVKGKVSQKNIYDPFYKPNYYDIITILDVIEHVPDPEKFLQRINDLLKPGGKAYITTPADNGETYLIRYLANKIFGIDKEAHGHETEGFSSQQLNNLFNRTNFQITHSTRYSKLFTETIELAYNAAYLLKNRKKQQISGYNLSLSPAGNQDFTRHQNIFPFLKIIHPVLLAISKLDYLLPERFGYEWGITVTKTQNPKNK